MGDDDQSTHDGTRALVILSANGHIEGASQAALELLGRSYEEVRGQSPRSLMALSDAESEALSQAWKTPGSKAAAGETTIFRADGTRRRVNFILASLSDGRHAVLLEPVAQPAEPGLVFYTMREVLAGWRSAVRRLETESPDSAEWMTTMAEIDAFREQYMRLFESTRHKGSRELTPT